MQSSALAWIHQIRARYEEELDPDFKVGRAKNDKRTQEFLAEFSWIKEKELFVEIKQREERVSEASKPCPGPFICTKIPRTFAPTFNSLSRC